MTTTRRTRTPRAKAGPLPPLPESAYPPDAEPLPVEFEDTVLIEDTYPKVIRLSNVAWWCPICDHSQTLKITECPQCGYVREVP